MPQLSLRSLSAAVRRPEVATSSRRRSLHRGKRVLGGLALALSCAAALAVPIAAQTSTDWMQARVLAARSGHAMAYDVARQRVVLFGGNDRESGALSDTWEWDGNDWTQRAPATSPSARQGHAVVYDVARHRIVLFGGLGRPGFLADTWEWDGNDWTQRTPATNPNAREGHAMAYDVARHRVVLFGGRNDSDNPVLSDTWEWDGSNWTLRTPTTSPSARFDHAIAYAIARQRVVLFGGTDSGSVFADTWEWDGGNWIQRTPTTSPSVRFDHAIAYDIARQRVVLFGGAGYPGAGGTPTLSDTWEWDGSNWTQRAPVTSPPARFGHTIAYDIARLRVVVFGGAGSAGGPPLSDLSEWDGGNWTPRSSATTPGGLAGHAMAYDIGRQQVVLFGGSDRHGAFADTWEWDGDRWTRRAPAASPSARAGHAMVHDVARQRVVLFGGAVHGGVSAETWEWDGNDWALRTPTTSPSARFGHAIAYDVARQRVVLFGGDSYGNGFLSDTWEWDGTDWAQLSPATTPGGMTGHAMTYDVARQRIVLFGGDSYGNGLLSDTWEWDGSNWTQRAPVTSPPARFGHAIAYDVARQRVVLFGGLRVGLVGNPGAGGYAVGDTWEWDGSNWTLQTPATNPLPRVGHAMAYDAAYQRMVVFGGGGTPSRRGTRVFYDTWLYGALRPATAQPFGTACAGSNGLPVLTSDTPHLGNRAFTLELLSARPTSLCMFGLSAGTQPIALGSCTLYLHNVLVTVLTTTNHAGVAECRPFAIPLDPTLRGALLYAQAFVAEPAGPVLGVASSAGLRLTLGD